MTAEQVVVVLLLVAAFAAGWFARDPPRRRRGGGREDAPADPTAAAAREQPAEDPAPIAVAQGFDASPAAGDVRPLVGAVADGLANAVDAWMADRPAGPPLATLDAVIARLRGYAERHPSPQAAEALDAAVEARAVLAPFAEGRPFDAASSRSLEPLEDRLAAAR